MTDPPLRLLLIEDNPADARLFQAFLHESQTPFALTHVERLQPALACLQQQPFDVVLADLSLPDSQGLATVLTLYSHAPALPLIVLTGLDDETLALRALHEGAQDYLVKSQITSGLWLSRALRYAIERKRIQTQLQDQERQIRQQAALLDIATDAILVRDFQHRILFWNKGAERVYGWRAAEAYGKATHTLLFDTPCPEIDAALKAVLAQGEWQGELTKITKSGHTVIVESRWALVRDEHQQPYAILSVDTDITERKQLQTQALRTQRLESIGTLASGIAHDLNNILTPILAAAQLIQHKLPMLDDQTQRLLSIIEDNTRRGADLIKQVLAFTRGVEGKRITLQMRHLITDLQKVIRETFPKNIEVQIEVAPDLWVVSGDSTQLHQVLMNLCVNARDAMPQGGCLRLRAQNQCIEMAYTRLNLEAKAGNYVVITVADTGIGIEPGIMDRVFEPFFTTKAHGQGTGLGLSTVMGITKSHGGFVEVSSHVGRGTQFRIFLPAAAAAELEVSPTPVYPRGQGEVILVVDDEATIRETAQTSLELWGYQVLVASNGVEALERYQQHRQEIGLVLLDLFMPIMGGETAIQHLKQLNPQLNIIAMSGLGFSASATECALPPDLPFLPKPFSAQDLLLCVNALLQRTSASETG